ncbi:sigma-70 family RNA polymerase sigma factor [Cohnella endophytica]|uniref:Sigma-70 family RNA polymerase sigma factor n=1 Tax=Cohnella endophytica TaxID=2419778 RepID=A0A494XBH1_9BACL|nr:sigma-70 family RNA polymerase sigma factor [Cohnella endophytica]RKP45836.1 sigma-70 family RNA polymerase sigma factor [Cohnella endophytica]
MSLTQSARQPDDAIAMLLEYQKTLCNDLADRLIRNYEPMVKMAANKMSRNRPDLYDDLFQVGQMSLFRLLKQFDPELGMPFEPYAMKSMIGHMKNYLRDKSWYIQVPRRIKEKGLVVQHAIDELMSKLERSPNVDEIAEFLGLDAEETLEILAGRDLYHYVSLDTPISDDDNTAVLGELIGASSDDFATLERKLDLQEAMEQLKPEERQVLMLVFESGLSQRSIAEQLGVSQMSISRIQKRAIDKLKHLIEKAEED